MTIAKPNGPASFLMMGDGVSWTGNANQSANITYTFSDIPNDGMTAMTAAEQTSAIAAMQQWSNVANITFTANNNPFNSAGANIHYGQVNFPQYVLGATSYATQGSRMMAANIAMDTDPANYSVGGSGFTTMLHEIGHALGLDHFGNYGQGETPPFVPHSQDTTDLSVMSYYNGTYTSYDVVNPTGPMLYDIAAIQYLYGANRSYHSGNDTYTIDGSAKAYALWDGGGNDTIDSSSYAQNVILDLREGDANVNDVGNSAVWAAFGANIENATSGAGNDLINGNALNNNLIGNAGMDTISGNEGNDTIDGGQGNDSLQGNVGNDNIIGGDGDDYVRGGQGNDILQGNLGNDSLYGDLGDDNIRGGQGNDAIYAGDGVDTIYGDKGDDMLYGNGGDDRFVFTADSGHDTVYDFTGAGIAGGDILSVSSLFANAANGLLDDITYTGGNAIITLDDHTNITLIGVSGGLVAGDFLIG